MRFKAVKPNWGRKFLGTKPNPDFKEEIIGLDSIEGEYDEEFIKQKNKEGYNIYFFPNYSSKPLEGFLNSKDIDVFEFVYVDMDLKDGIYATHEDFFKVVKEFELPPTLVVYSGNGIHVYWSVSNLTRASFVELQLRLITKFKTDESIWTVCHVMRYPGTLNTKKHNDYCKCEINTDFSSEKVYLVEDFNNVLPSINIDQKNTMEIHLSKIDGTYKSPVISIENPDKLPKKFEKMIENFNLFHNPKMTYGDRSGADMALCNKLRNDGYTIHEAYQVMLNTEKAKSRTDRESYATSIIEKVYKDKLVDKIYSVLDIIRSGVSIERGNFVNGPRFLDCTEEGWRQKEVLAVIGAEGTGKSSVAMNLLKHIINNNSDEDIYIYFSLEMSKEDVIKRWIKMVGKDSVLSSRLYVVENLNEDGSPRYIGLQEIYHYVKEIETKTGRKAKAVIIDHISIMSTTIDTTKEPNFNIQANKQTGYGDKLTMTREDVAGRFKMMAQMLDVFFIALSQTTKEKGGEGDLPINGNCAFGISQMNWFADFVITIWQPLRKVHHSTNLRTTAWQYCKIREKNETDLVKEYDARMLNFDLNSNDYRPLTDEEEAEFEHWLDVVNKMRMMEIKKTLNKSHYRNSPMKAVADLKRILENKE